MPGERRLQKHWAVGSRAAFGMGICFVAGQREMWLETSFPSEGIVFCKVLRPVFYLPQTPVIQVSESLMSTEWGSIGNLFLVEKPVPPAVVRAQCGCLSVDALGQSPVPAQLLGPGSQALEQASSSLPVTGSPGL